MNDFLKKITSLVFPNTCIFCDEFTDNNDNVCEICKSQLPYITPPVCEFCGRNLEDCYCRNKPQPYDFLCAPFYYEGIIKKAIYNMKFSKR